MREETEELWDVQRRSDLDIVRQVGQRRRLTGTAMVNFRTYLCHLGGLSCG